MISGLDLNAVIDYVLKDDKDNPTVWKLGVIPGYLFAKLITDTEKKDLDMVYRVVQVAIKGWENSNVPFETQKEKLYGREIDVIPINVLERFSLKVITELFQKSIEINQLTENETKNS